MKAPFALSLSKGNDVHFLCKAPDRGTAGSSRLGPALPPLILLRSEDRVKAGGLEDSLRFVAREARSS